MIDSTDSPWSREFEAERGRSPTVAIAPSTRRPRWTPTSTPSAPRFRSPPTISLPARVGNARRRVSDAELVTLGFGPGASWAFPRTGAFSPWPGGAWDTSFPGFPGQSGYHKRRRRLAETIDWLSGVFAAASPGLRRRPGAARLHPGRVRALDPDRAPLGPGRLAPATAGAAAHSRFFWGMRLHLVCALDGTPRAAELVAGPTAPSARWRCSFLLRSPARRRDRGRRQGLCRARLRGSPWPSAAGPWCAPGAPTSPSHGPLPRARSASASRRSFRRLKDLLYAGAPRGAHPRGAAGPHRRSPAGARRLRLGSTTSSAVRAASSWSLRSPELMESVI